MLSCSFNLKKRHHSILSLHAISVFQFKNYDNANFLFTERIVGICGKNGIGKTNLLDAIYTLCFTKSYFNRSDAQNVQHTKDGFRLEGDFVKKEQDIKVVSVLRENGKKEFLVDGQAYDRLARHIGLLPAVIIAPDDAQLITGGSEERRRFLDTLFCQLDPGYLQELITYNKVLQQRNGYLKSVEDRRQIDQGLLDAYDQQLAKHGNLVYSARRRFLNEMIPLVHDFYQLIAGKDEEVKLTYESQLTDSDPATLLQKSREKDIVLQRTNTGIHRDDLQILLGSRPFKSDASQGQRKSLLFALKLAEFQTLKTHKGFTPLLLLDDVFEKLDEQRIRNLLHWVCLKNNGQIFITDTHAERFMENINYLGIKYQLVDI